MARYWTNLAALLLIHSTTAFKLVCHFSNWSQYRTGVGRFMVEDIDPFLCTHVVYDFAVISHDNKLKENEWGEKSSYQALNQLKDRNSELKTLLSVQKSSNNDKKFSQMLSTEVNRRTFIQSSISVLRTYGFDGLELDLDHPGEDKHKLTQLCKELWWAFDKESVGGRARLLLSASLTPRPDVFTLQHYEVTEMSKVMDFISVKTFDLSLSGVTSHHSPLYSSNNACIDHVIQSWQDQNAPTKNLLLGFPAHSRSYTLSTEASDPGAPMSGPAPPGPYTHKMGFWSYYETCVFLQGASPHWIDSQHVPYAVKTSKWVGFDNKNSYSEKVTYLKSKRLGGAAVWSIDMDDFSGEFCGQGSYPLINQLRADLSTELSNTTPIDPEPPQTTDRPHSANSPATGGGVGGTGGKSCFHNITVEYPDPSLCKGKADGHYQTPQEPTLAYTCALGKAYITECPTVHSRGQKASWDDLLLFIHLISALHKLSSSCF